MLIVRKGGGRNINNDRYLYLNVDDNPQLAARYGVRSIPTILFMKGGQVMDQVIGAVPKSQLKKKLDALT